MGTPAAYLMARRQFPGKVLLDNLIDLPTACRWLCLGAGATAGFRPSGLDRGMLDDIGLRITFTATAVVTSAFVAALLVRAVIGFACSGAEDAAAMDGATLLQIFWRMTLPLSRMSFLIKVAAWARAMGEFGAMIIFCRKFSWPYADHALQSTSALSLIWKWRLRYR
ncbi:MAG: hypothetical protein R3C44_13800 [Chloroflexota bacterium]